jgi:hypothetical protein
LFELHGDERVGYSCGIAFFGILERRYFMMGEWNEKNFFDNGWIKSEVFFWSQKRS